MPPDNSSEKKINSSPSILAKVAALGVALNIIPTDGTARKQVSQALETGTSFAEEKEAKLNIEQKEKFKLPHELIAEQGVKATLVEAIKDYPGLKFIGKFQGNGGREALIYVPEGFDPSQPVELIYHFHGTNGELIDEKYPKIPGANARYESWVRQGKIAMGGDRLSQVLDETAEAGKKSENKITVYPLSAGQRGPEGSAAEKNGYDAFWMRKENDTGDDMVKFDEEVRKTLTDKMNLTALNISGVTLKGHSAGGQPLKNIALSGFIADRIDFLDASYGWAKIAYQAAVKNNPQVEFNVFTIPGTATTPDAMSLKGKRGVEVIEVNGIVHADMNRNFFNWERRKESKKEEN